jgi:hypothetical protein
MVRQVANWLDEACDFCQRARPVILLFLYIAVLSLSLYGMINLWAWWKDDEPAVAFTQGEAAMPQGRPGDMMIVYQPVTKHRDCEGVIHRVMTGTCGHIVLSEKHSTLQAGFSGRLTIPFQIPHEAIPGQCGFRVHARYVCNPFDWILQRQVFVSPIIPFQVKGWNRD